jgi:hypothetical protein
VRHLHETIPEDWTRVKCPVPEAAAWMHRTRQISVIVGVEVHSLRYWAHLSVSHRDRIPTWEELCLCKEIFLGDVKAIQVFPIKSEWVNVNDNVLHLWASDSLDIPDFRRLGGL